MESKQRKTVKANLSFVKDTAKKAVNQASINQGDVQSFMIVVPPLDLQKSFAAFVSQVDKSKLSPSQSLQIG